MGSCSDRHLQVQSIFVLQWQRSLSRKGGCQTCVSLGNHSHDRMRFLKIHETKLINIYHVWVVMPIYLNISNVLQFDLSKFEESFYSRVVWSHHEHQLSGSLWWCAGRFDHGLFRALDLLVDSIIFVGIWRGWSIFIFASKLAEWISTYLSKKSFCFLWFFTMTFCFHL